MTRHEVIEFLILMGVPEASITPGGWRQDENAFILYVDCGDSDVEFLFDDQDKFIKMQGCSYCGPSC